MIYPPLPERVTTGQIWRFTVFGARGDIAPPAGRRGRRDAGRAPDPGRHRRRAGLSPFPTAGPRCSADMMILLVAASIGSAGFQVVRAVALVRLGTHIDLRLQAAVWDRVMRLRTSFFRRYSVGDLALRILGIDAIRRILAGQTLNGLISGVFSLASLGIMLIYDVSLALFAVGYAVVAAGFLFVLGRAADAARAHRLRPQGHRDGPADGDPGRHRQAAGRCRRAARLRALVERLRRAARQRCPVGPPRRLADSSSPRACPSSARSACWRSPPAATIRSRSPPSPPSTAPSASSPPPCSAFTTSLNVADRGGAAVRPHPPGVRGAARGRREPHRSRRARRPRRRSQPVVPLFRGRAVDARRHRLRGAARREHRHRRRLGLGQVDPAAPAARLRDAGARRRLLRRPGSRDARPAAGAPPDRHRAGDGRPRARQRSSTTSPAAPRSTRDQVMEAVRLAGLDADIAAMPMGLETLRDGRRQPALGRPAPARDDRPRAGQPAAADLPRPGDQRARQPHPGDRGREPGGDERHAHRHRPSPQHDPRRRSHPRPGEGAASSRAAPTTSWSRRDGAFHRLVSASCCSPDARRSPVRHRKSYRTR